jgi:hypothetical protein
MDDCCENQVPSNGNLLKKKKAILAKEVASIKNFEIFGVGKCEATWEEIFKDYLIIDALKCMPYNFYSKDDENCLISKLSENCNC